MRSFISRTDVSGVEERVIRHRSARSQTRLAGGRRCSGKEHTTVRQRRDSKRSSEQRRGVQRKPRPRQRRERPKRPRPRRLQRKRRRQRRKQKQKRSGRPRATREPVHGIVKRRKSVSTCGPTGAHWTVESRDSSRACSPPLTSPGPGRGRRAGRERRLLAAERTALRGRRDPHTRPVQCRGA